MSKGTNEEAQVELLERVQALTASEGREGACLGFCSHVQGQPVRDRAKPVTALLRAGALALERNQSAPG